MVYRFGDCDLDTERCELRRAGEVCHVEPQVYDLLVHLVLNRDRLVTRDELLDAIWGHRFVTPSTLSSRIKALRQAVGDDGATQGVVRTVRGRGFRFVADVVVTEEAHANAARTRSQVPGPRAEPPAPAPRRTGRDQQIRFCHGHDGVRIAYATCGDGPPLVKTANWLTHLDFDWGSPVWRHMLAELSREHTLIRYDERGCGLSDWTAEDLCFDAWVRDLEHVVDELGLESFPIFGVSQGAAVAIAYAAKHPERVSRLILYGGYALGRRHRPEPNQRDDAALFEQMLPLGWGRDNPAFRQFFATLFLPEGTAEQHSWFGDLQRQSSTPENGARLMAEFYDINVEDLARRVQAPTLVMHASADAVVPFSAGRHLASLIPGAKFVPLWGRNHILLETEPAWARFVQELRAFLAAGDPAIRRA